MSPTDAEHLASAQVHLARLREHLLRGDLDDETVFDAVCIRLSAAIESVSVIEERLRIAEFGPS